MVTLQHATGDDLESLSKLYEELVSEQTEQQVSHLIEKALDILG